MLCPYNCGTDIAVGSPVEKYANLPVYLTCPGCKRPFLVVTVQSLSRSRGPNETASLQTFFSLAAISDKMRNAMDVLGQHIEKIRRKAEAKLHQGESRGKRFKGD